MSSCTDSDSSHVLDIRKKTAQERLRGDHIDLLYQLEDATKLNDRYEKEIEQLKKLLEESKKPDSVVIVEESGEIIDGHLRTIETLQGSLTDLTTEIKTMKTKEVLAQKSHQKQLEAMRLELDRKTSAEEAVRNSYEQRKKDLEEMLAARNTPEVIPASDTESGNSDVILELENKCIELEKQLKNSVEIIEENDKASRAKDETHENECKKRQETYMKQKSVILSLEGEKDEIRSLLLEAEEIIAELRSKLRAEERSTAALLASMPATVLSPLKPCSPTLCEASMQTMPETEVGPAKDIEKEKDSAMANQFKDYVALKKEIMSLKLQLAHKESSGRRNSGSGFGQSSNVLLSSTNRSSSNVRTSSLIHKKKPK